jgi:acyl carrier protein
MSNQITTNQITEDNTEAIEAWLLEQIATYLRTATAEVKATVPLAEYGMDSIFALALCGDIEEHFGLVVEPTLAWDYPTVAQIAVFLNSELAGK